LNIFPSGKIYFYKRDSEKIFEIKVEDKDALPNKISKSTTALLEL
jgi:hypothetical protein